MEVLIVDDDIFLRLDLSDRLRRRGFSVFRVSDADQAIGIMEKHPSIAAVFSDLQMPGSMDGLALLHEVSRRWPGRRLILISGLNSPSEHDMPPNTLFFSKPLSRLSLDRVIQGWPDFPPTHNLAPPKPPAAM